VVAAGPHRHARGGLAGSATQHSPVPHASQARSRRGRRRGQASNPGPAPDAEAGTAATACCPPAVTAASITRSAGPVACGIQLGPGLDGAPQRSLSGRSTATPGAKPRTPGASAGERTHLSTPSDASRISRQETPSHRPSPTHNTLDPLGIAQQLRRPALRMRPPTCPNKGRFDPPVEAKSRRHRSAAAQPVLPLNVQTLSKSSGFTKSTAMGPPTADPLPAFAGKEELSATTARLSPEARARPLKVSRLSLRRSPPRPTLFNTRASGDHSSPISALSAPSPTQRDGVPRHPELGRIFSRTRPPKQCA